MLEQGIRNPEFGADKFGFRDLKGVNWNFLEPELYECALKDGEAQVTSGGALCAETGVHTGRSPKDKYIVCDDQTEQTIWWENNGKMTPAQFARLYQDFIAHSAGKTLYAQDLRAGADPEFGLRTRVFTMLEDEFLRSRAMILRVTGQRELLARNRVLARSIHLRNPYVDPMSLIQVELLRRKQQGQDLAKLEYPLGATINGIAAGLHNTG